MVVVARDAATRTGFCVVVGVPEGGDRKKEDPSDQQ